MPLDEGAYEQFSPNAIQARKDAWLGAASINTSPKHWFLLLLIVLSTSLGTLLLAFLHYMDSIDVPGVVVDSNGIAQIVPPFKGVVQEVLAKQGDSVKKGERLFTVLLERASANGRFDAGRVSDVSMEDRLKSVDSQIESGDSQLRVLGESRKTSAVFYASEKQHLIQQRTLAERQLSLAKEEVAKYMDLATQGYVSLIGSQTKQQGALTIEQHLSELDRQLEQLDRQVFEAEVAYLDAKAKWQRDRYALQSSRASVLAEKAASSVTRESAVLAPIDGRLAMFDLKPGQQLGDEVVGSIISGLGLLEVEIYIPSAVITKVNVGQEVRVLFPSPMFEERIFMSGKITSLSTVPMADKAAKRGAENSYVARVDLPQRYLLLGGQQRPLVPGITVTAKVIQGKTTFLYWLFSRSKFALRGSS